MSERLGGLSIFIAQGPLRACGVDGQSPLGLIGSMAPPTEQRQQQDTEAGESRLLSPSRISGGPRWLMFVGVDRVHHPDSCRTQVLRMHGNRCSTGHVVADLSVQKWAAYHIAYTQIDHFALPECIPPQYVSLRSALTCGDAKVNGIGSGVGLFDRIQLISQATGVWVHLHAAAYSAGVR